MNWLLSLVLSTAFARTHHKVLVEQPFPGKTHMTKVATCDVKDATRKVYILKQWHLAPTTITKSFKEKYPQEKNQTALYHALEEGVKRKQLELLVSEGCEGEINSDFKPSFNGWDYAALKGQSNQKGYDKIITLVPLKIEVKYGDKIKTLCGDSEPLIQEGNLRLSNMRGWFGFYSRLTENKDKPEKFKFYADSAIDLMKLPKDTPKEKVLSEVKDRLKEELAAFQKSLADRDDAFLLTLQNQDFSKAAIVIGGLHAEDLKAKVEKAGIACEVLEPPGYQRDDEKLIQDFARALN